MRRFHEWSATLDQLSLRGNIRGNHNMAEMKYSLTYGRLKESIAMYPAISSALYRLCIGHC
jgi:hypothetical protein